MKEKWRKGFGAIKRQAESFLGKGDLVSKGLALVADNLRSLLGRCPACDGDFSDHLFTRFAMTVYAEGRERRVNDFILALRERRWQEATSFREFEGSKDALVAHALRCPGSQIVVIVLLEPYDFDDTPSVFEQQVLDPESSQRLESLIGRDQWVPFN